MKERNKLTNDTIRMNIWQIQLANLNKAEAYRKRKTQRHLQDKAYFEPVYKVPKGGFGLSLNTPFDEGICFLRPSQTEYFEECFQVKE